MMYRRFAEIAGKAATFLNNYANATIYTAVFQTAAGTQPATEQAVVGNSLGVAATVSPTSQFVATPLLALGTNTSSTASALSGGGTLGNSTISGITVSSPSAQSLSYDANRNQTNTAASSYPQYSYDAENRLVKITYDSTGTNYTTLVYDPFDRVVSIAETGTSPSYFGNATKQFVYLGASKLEERDGSGKFV